MDQAGNLYGTTQFGGLTNDDHCNFSQEGGCGTVFNLTHTGLGWQLTSLYKFSGESDGGYPWAGVIFGPDGSLYGTTTPASPFQRAPYDQGTVYRLAPNGCLAESCEWTDTVLHRFLTFEGGEYPSDGNLIFDGEGNIYGTTMYGGTSCTGGSCGVVYELMGSGDSWTYSIIYSFTGGSDGDQPSGGVIFDPQGNLYGETTYGGIYQYGNAYELTSSGPSWTESTIYNFGFGGAYPGGGLIINTAAAFYGITCCDPAVFELSQMTGTWTLNVLYSWGSGYLNPNGPLATDAAGNLYGTTQNGGSGDGNVFKLTPSSRGWVYSDLHDFRSSESADGAAPLSGVILDTHGNIYGTTAFGGDISCNPPSGCGVVWEITPN